MCNGIKVTCSFMMNCHAIIHINVCNWFTHLQPEWQTTCHIDDSIFTVNWHQCFQYTVDVAVGQPHLTLFTLLGVTSNQPLNRTHIFANASHILLAALWWLGNGIASIGVWSLGFYFLLIGLKNFLISTHFGFIVTLQLIFRVALFLTLCMCCVVFPDHNHSSRRLSVVC